jgi:hypothetical protein
MAPTPEIKDAPLFDIHPLTASSSQPSALLGYYVKSTALTHVEDEEILSDAELSQKEQAVKAQLRTIAAHLVKSEKPEIVVHIHGYAVRASNAEAEYNRAYQYASENHLGAGSHVLIGYRWPAENPLESLGKNFSYAFQALPSLLLNILISALVAAIVLLLLSWDDFAANQAVALPTIALISIAISLLIWKFGKAKGFIPLQKLIVVPGLTLLIVTLTPIANAPALFLVFLASISGLVLGLVLALVALRLVTYPHDRYRALNYAVMDLVAFFRELEKEICALDSDKRKLIEEANPGDKIRIKVSFIAHSLGSEVTTHTVRILSDVFDSSAVEGHPGSAIGDVFSLGRLVMAAPDIPIESVLASRANFLKSSLRRFEEAYVFSNEGDLALRLASTAANYFAFPFRSRLRGYKLGNITAKRDRDRKKICYGILNFNFDTGETGSSEESLEIRASTQQRVVLKNLKQEQQRASQTLNFIEADVIANGFTYFDCTDYVEKNPKGMLRGILSLAPRKSALNWTDYTHLAWKYFVKGRIDPHGGYFAPEAVFSRNLIYKLAFLGYRQLLLGYQDQPAHQSSSPTPSNASDLEQQKQQFEQQVKTLFQRFSDQCKAQQIQVVLASRGVPKPASQPIGRSAESAPDA